MDKPTGLDLATAGDAAAREDEGVSVHIRDPQGEPMYYETPEGQRPVTIRIAGTYSAVFKKTQNLQRERQFKQRLTMLTPEMLNRNQIELVAACVLAWDGVVDRGTPLPCTKENATRLLEQAVWLRDQLEEVQRDHAGFFSPPSTS